MDKVVEGIVTILGLCITFIPVLFYFNYLLTHVSKKTRFDYHLELVRDKKGRFGVIVAYAERIIFGMLVCSLGILLEMFFQSEFFFVLTIILFVLYVIVKYFDEKNEK